MPVDLLMLNATNYEPYPVYPYAFVQVRALGAQHGVSVAGADVFGISPAAVRDHLARLLGELRPRAIGVHVRQADSLLLSEYHPSSSSTPYFPLTSTSALIALVRELSDRPIIAGGFGFTTHAERLFRRLGVDVGVRGAPDAMLESFDDVVRGRNLERVDNLLFARGDELVCNPRSFGTPLGEREYDEATVVELERFYGRPWLFGDDPPTVAVELARGCPYRCYFCTEPAVKGRRPRVRDLEAVMADVEFLAGKGVRRFWLVCSELNIGGSDLAVAVAERFVRFNETRDVPVAWRAYTLPRWLDEATLALLYRSGFAGSWNDFPALDDATLKASRVPYRAADVVEHARVTATLAPDGPDGRGAKLGLFLGNAFATPSSIATTLDRFDRDLSGRFPRAEVGVATRLFDPVVDVLGDDTIDGAQTYSADGPRPTPDLCDPTFFIPPAIRHALGGTSETLAFFDYVKATLLAGEHRRTRDWCRFLRTSASVAWLVDEVRQAAPSPHAAALPPVVRERFASVWSTDVTHAGRELEALIDPSPTDHAASNVAALLLCEALRSLPCPAFGRFAAARGIAVGPDGRVKATTPIRLLRAFVSRDDSEDALIAAAVADLAAPDAARLAWRLRRLIYEHDLRIDRRFRAFLVEAA